MEISKCVTLDVETYPNYFLVMFRRVVDGKVIFFEKFNDSELDRGNILGIMKKYTIITFNGLNYDMPVVLAAMKGINNRSIFEMSNRIIEKQMKGWQTMKQYGLQDLEIDHIDIIEVCPLTASLKIYAGRRHSETIMDLPLKVGTVIKDDQRQTIIDYCEIDNKNTAEIFEDLREEVILRENLGNQYGVDLRSKSDAQMAEVVIKKELQTKHNIRAKRPKIEEGTEFYYKAPDNIEFVTEELKDIYRQYTEKPITVNKSGKTDLMFDNGTKHVIISLGISKYKLGVGGIHSKEKSIRFCSDEETIIRDFDVAAFYPNIILNNRLYPEHLGDNFLNIYQSLVDRRLKAKAEGDKVINESLKITINGSFGKLGSKWSAIYAPDLMAQVTITGQLSLLMLIEQLELNGVSVVSANTDGIVTKFHPKLEIDVDNIISEWEMNTGYEMEATDYTSLNSRDVNNYIAVKPNLEVKGKGDYAYQGDHYYRFRKNPTRQVCVEAIKEFLTYGTPVDEYILNCKDITQFTCLRVVKGGAVKEGKPIGKSIRWYYGKYELDAIHYATNGNKVPKSDGAVPLMELPDSIPRDIDYAWYIEEAKIMLKSIGYKF